MEIAATSILESGATTGTVTLSQASDRGGLTVNLLNSDNTEATSLNTSTLTFAWAGETPHLHPYRALRDGFAVGLALQSVTITASEPPR